MTSYLQTGTLDEELFCCFLHVFSEQDPKNQNCPSLPGGLQAFRGFLRSEFSEENLEFWLACEDFRVSPSNLLKNKASKIYSQFVNPEAPLEVSEDKPSSSVNQDKGQSFLLLNR